MQAFLERERYSGGQHPTALMAKLRSAPRARVGELELAARRQLVLSFVAMVRTLNAQIKDLERAIRGQVRATFPRTAHLAPESRRLRATTARASQALPTGAGFCR